jgi:ketosteroid isomerase-like protein
MTRTLFDPPDGPDADGAGPAGRHLAHHKSICAVGGGKDVAASGAAAAPERPAEVTRGGEGLSDPGRSDGAAAELGVEPMSDHAVRQHIRRLPMAAKTLGRRGEREFERRCLPKIRVDYSGVAAGEWLCLDGRVADVQVRIPDASGGWSATRLSVTGVLDLRSSKMIVEVRRSESWVGILAGLRKWNEAHGLPGQVTMDRGKAYGKTARAHGGKGWCKGAVDVERLGSVFERFEIQVHKAIAYHPWAKKIESIWRLIKRHCDRWSRSFWGGNPAERSYVAVELVKHHVEELPTEQEFADCLQTAVDTYNATPRRALGGLSPDEMFERYRGTERRVDPDVFDTYFTVAVGPRRVGRDGVTYQSVLYTLAPEDLIRLQDRQVWILPRLDSVGVVALCDRNEKLLCYATQQQLVRAGAKDEHARAAFAKAARVRRLAREYLSNLDFLLETPTGQILREKRDFAKAEAAARRKTMAPPPAPNIAIVRPDLADGVRKLKKRAGPFQRLAETMGQGAATGAESPPCTRRATFEKLAAASIEIPAPEEKRVDWSRFADDGGMEAAAQDRPAVARTAEAG